MSTDKHPSVFSCQMEAIAFIILQIYFATHTYLKILSASYSACVVYTKTVIHISVGESEALEPQLVHSCRSLSRFL